MSTVYSAPALAAEFDVIARMAKDLDRRMTLIYEHAPAAIKARMDAMPQMGFDGMSLHRVAAALADELEMV